MSTLEHIVLQSEHYHPVVQINLHKGLKCKIKIITSVRPQSTVLFSAIQLAGSLSPQLLCRGSGGGGGGGGGTRLGYQEASNILLPGGMNCGMNTLPLDYLCSSLSPLFTYLSLSLAFTLHLCFPSCLIIPHLVADSFCINMSSIVLIAFCQSEVNS